MERLRLTHVSKYSNNEINFYYKKIGIRIATAENVCVN